MCIRELLQGNIVAAGRPNGGCKVQARTVAVFIVSRVASDTTLSWALIHKPPGDVALEVLWTWPEATVPPHDVSMLEDPVEGGRQLTIRLKCFYFGSILDQALLELIDDLIDQVGDLLKRALRIADLAHDLFDQVLRALAKASSELISHIIAVVVHQVTQFNLDPVQGILSRSTVIQHALCSLVIDDHDGEYRC